MFRCYSAEARYASGAPANLENRGVTGGSQKGNVSGIGPDWEGNIYIWFVDAR